MISGEGSIPEGEHWIQLADLQENSGYRIRNDRRTWGDHWITIHPYPDTQTYQRGGFFIHGGRIPGSSGCIDLSIFMGQFVKALSEELRANGNCHVPLTVRYSP